LRDSIRSRPSSSASTFTFSGSFSSAINLGSSQMRASSGFAVLLPWGWGLQFYWQRLRISRNRSHALISASISSALDGNKKAALPLTGPENYPLCGFSLTRRSLAKRHSSSATSAITLS
jgi:hypothetical protein